MHLLFVLSLIEVFLADIRLFVQITRIILASNFIIYVFSPTQVGKIQKFVIVYAPDSLLDEKSKKWARIMIPSVRTFIGKGTNNWDYL